MTQQTENKVHPNGTDPYQLNVDGFFWYENQYIYVDQAQTRAVGVPGGAWSEIPANLEWIKPDPLITYKPTTKSKVAFDEYIRRSEEMKTESRNRFLEKTKVKQQNLDKVETVTTGSRITDGPKKTYVEVVKNVDHVEETSKASSAGGGDAASSMMAYVMSFEDEKERERAREFVKRVSVRTDFDLTRDAGEMLKRQFELRNETAKTAILIMKGMTRGQETNFSIQKTLDKNRLFQYSFLTSDYDQMRINLHDILLTVLLSCSEEYKGDRDIYKKENKMTEPVNNDGSIGDRVIEFTTTLRRTQNGIVKQSTAINKSHREKLEQYRRFIENDRIPLKKFIMDLWIIDITPGESVIRQLVKLKTPMGTILASLILTTSEKLSRFIVPVRENVPKSTTESDEYFIEKFLTEKFVKLAGKETEYYDGMDEHSKEMKRKFGNLEASEIKSILMNETEKVIPAITDDFAEMFVTVTESCSKLPVVENGLTPDEAFKMMKDGDRRPLGLLTTVGNRVGDIFMPSMEWASEQMKESNASVMFESTKLDHHRDKDARQAHLVVKIIDSFSQLEGEKAEQLQDIGRKMARMKYMITQQEREMALAELKWVSIEEGYKRQREILQSVRTPPGMNFVPGALLELKEEDDQKRAGLKKNESHNREQWQIEDTPEERKAYARSTYQTTEDESSEAIMNRVLLTKQQFGEMSGEEKGIMLIDQLYGTLRKPTVEEKRRVIGVRSNLNEHELYGPAGKVEQMRDDLLKAFQNFSELMDDKTAYYTYQKFNLALQSSMKFNPAFSKSQPLNAVSCWMDDGRGALYICTNPKSQTNSGSFTKITAVERDRRMDAQTQIDEIHSRISILDIQNRSYIVTDSTIFKISQTFRFADATFGHTEEYLGSYIGLRILLKSAGLTLKDNLLPSIYLDIKRSVTDALDLIYYIYKQTSYEGSPSKFDIDDFMSDHNMSDLRVALIYSRMRSYFPEFNAVVRNEVLAGRCFKWSRKVMCPVSKLEMSSLLHVSIITYLKNGGWKNDGMDPIKYIFDFVVKEMGFEKDVQKYRFNDMKKTLKDETISQYYERIRFNLSKNKSEDKLRHHLRITYLTARLAALQIKKIFPQGVDYSMMDIDPTTGTGSMVLVPVPLYIMKETIDKSQNEVFHNSSGFRGDKRTSKAQQSDRYQVIINRLTMNMSIASALAQSDQPDTQLYIALRNLIQIGQSVVKKAIHDQLREKAKEEREGNGESEIQLGEDKNMYTQFGERAGQEIPLKFSSRYGPRRPYREQDFKTLEEINKEAEGAIDLDLDAGGEGWSLDSLNDQYEEDVILNHLADKTILEEEEYSSIFESFKDILGTKAKRLLTTTNRRLIEIAEFQRIMWSLIPTPTNSTLTVHSVVQQHALLAAETAYMKIFNMKETPSMLELSCFLDEMEYTQTTVKACLKHQYGFGKRIFFIQTLNAWVRNKVCEEFIRKFLNHVAEDVLHLPGAEKNMEIQNTAESYPMTGPGGPFGLFTVAGDLTRYGDTFSLYVMTTTVAAMKDAGLMSEWQFKYIMYTHNCLRYRRLILPTDYVTYIRRHMRPILEEMSFKVEKDKQQIHSDADFYYTVRESATWTRIQEKLTTRQRNDVTYNDPRAKEDINVAKILTLLMQSKMGMPGEFGATHHTLGLLYLQRTIGFVLGVLNMLASFCSALRVLFSKSVLNYWFEGLAFSMFTHSDDSIAMANIPSMQSYFMKVKAFKDERDNICKHLSKGGTFKLLPRAEGQINSILTYIDNNGVEVDRNMLIGAVTWIVASFNHFVAGLFGQRDSTKKTLHGPCGEFLQKLVVNGRCFDPAYSAVSAILRPMTSTSPKDDLLSTASRVYNIICNFPKPDVVYTMMFMANWFVKVKYRMPKIYSWQSDMALSGGFWATIADIILCQFKAPEINMLAYINKGTDLNLIKKLKKVYYITQTRHRFWKQFDPTTGIDQDWTVAIEEEEQPGSQMIKPSTIALRMGFNRRKMVDKLLAHGFGGLVAITPNASELTGDNASKIKKIVSENAYISLLKGKEKPQLKLSRGYLQLMQGGGASIYKIKQSNINIGCMGYLNREFEFRKRPEIKEGVRQAQEPNKRMLLGELISTVKTICSDVESEWVLEGEPEIDGYFAMDCRLFKEAIDAVWVTDRDFPAHIEETDFFLDQMPTWKYDVITVNTKQGVSQRVANVIASYVMEQALERSKAKEEGRGEVDLRIEDSFAYLCNTNLCNSQSFINEMKSLLGMLRLQDYDLLSLAPMIQSWVGMVSSDVHRLVLLKSPLVDIFTFLYAYTIVDDAIVVENTLAPAAVETIFHNQHMRPLQRELEEQTYLLLMCLYCRSRFTKSYTTGEVKKIDIEDDLLKIVNDGMPSSAVLDNFLSKIMFMMRFKENVNSKMISMWRGKKTFALKLMNVYFLIYEVEEDEEEMRFMFTTNVRDFSIFRFMLKFAHRYIVPDKLQLFERLSSVKHIRNGKANVSFTSHNELVRGQGNLPINLTEDITVWEDWKSILMGQKVKEMSINWDTFSFTDGTFNTCPWLFLNDGDTYIVDNITREPLSYALPAMSRQKLILILRFLVGISGFALKDVSTSKIIEYLVLHKLVMEALNVTVLIKELYNTTLPDMSVMERAVTYWDETSNYTKDAAEIQETITIIDDYISSMGSIYQSLIAKYNDKITKLNEEADTIYLNQGKRAKIDKLSERKLKALTYVMDSPVLARKGNEYKKYCYFSLAMQMGITVPGLPKVTGSSSLLLLANRTIKNANNDSTQLMIEAVFNYKKNMSALKGTPYKGNTIHPVVFNWEYSTKRIAFKENTDLEDEQDSSPDEGKKVIDVASNVEYDEVYGQLVLESVSGLNDYVKRMNKIQLDTRRGESIEEALSRTLLMDVHMPEFIRNRLGNQDFTEMLKGKILENYINVVYDMNTIVVSNRERGSWYWLQLLIAAVPKQLRLMNMTDKMRLFSLVIVTMIKPETLDEKESYNMFMSTFSV